MAKNEEKNLLDPEVLDGIQTFQGPVKSEDLAGEILQAGGAMQQVKHQFTTAVRVQEPRSMTRVANNVLKEAELAGSDFYYRWEVKTKHGRKPVEGGSIDLATCLFRNYGNCAMDLQVQETATHYIFTAYFIDLETGMTWPRMFRQRKTVDMGKFDKERAEDIVFQIGQSKCERNAILNIMPKWLIQQAIDHAKQAELNKLGDAKELLRARIAVVDYFEKWGIDQERLEAKLGRKADKFTPEDVEKLRGFATAIKERRARPEDLFPSPGKEERPEEQPEAREKVRPRGEEKESRQQPPAKPPKEKQEKDEPPWEDKEPKEASPEVDEYGLSEDNPWFRKKWINKKQTTFSTFVFKNLSTFPNIPAKLQGEAIQKWVNMYDDPFPIPPNKEGKAEEAPKEAPKETEAPPQEPQEETSESGGGIGGAESEKERNKLLAEEYPDEWERARDELGFAKSPATERAASIWNKMIMQFVEQNSV